MSKSIGRNRNHTNEAVINGPIALNSTTSVKIADANPNRIFFSVNNDNNANPFWLKLQAASVDNDKKGIFLSGLAGNKSFWEMPLDNIYTGEISAISVTGSPDAYFTEY